MVGGIWRRMSSILLVKNERSSSHFSVEGVSWIAVGGLVTEFITENRVLGLLLLVVIMFEKYSNLALMTAC